MSAIRSSRVRRATGLVAAVVASALALTACASGAASEPAKTAAAEGDAFPVAVKHAFGETTIAAAPKQVATIGWASFDAAIALGVIPASVGKSAFGADAAGWLPWTLEALQKAGKPMPKLHDERDGVPYEALSDLGLDLVLATNSGISQQEYDTLTKIAPTVAYAKTPWGTPWRENTQMVGDALGKPAETKRLIADTEQTIRDEMAKYPNVAGKTAMIIWVDAKDVGKVQYYTTNDTRLQYLSDLGVTIAPSIVNLSKGTEAFVQTISAEEADKLDADIAVMFVRGGGTLATVAQDPLLGKIPAVKSGSVVYIEDEAQLMAISSPSALSIPWSLPTYAKALGDAAAKVK